MKSLASLQDWKTGFDAKLIARLSPWFEPPAKNRANFVVLALAGIEIQPEAWIGIPITTTPSVGVNLL